MASDIFQDPEFDAANELLNERNPDLVAPDHFGPMTKPMDLSKLVEPAPAPSVSHDDDGVPTFENVPSSASLVAGHNRNLDDMHARASRDSDDRLKHTHNRGAAYLAAAKALEECRPDITGGQKKEYDRLVRQIRHTGTAFANAE